MSNKNGFLFAYYLDGEGGAEAVSLDELQANPHSDKHLWLHFNYMSKTVKKWLVNNTSLSKNIMEIFTQKEIRPRIKLYSDAILACLRTLNIDKKDDEENMVSFRLYLTEKLIVTARDRRVGFMEEIAQTLEAKNGPKTPLDLFSRCIETLTANIADHVNDLSDAVDDIETKELGSIRQFKQDEMTEIQRAIVFLRRHLLPQREALKSLSSSSSPLLSQRLKASLQETTNKVTRVLEELDLSKDRCRILQEKENTRISNEVNKRMYLFSLITAIFFPITTIASLFGMNLGGIPGASNAWAFTIASILLFGTSFLWIVLLKFKKWF